MPPGADTAAAPAQERPSPNEGSKTWAIIQVLLSALVGFLVWHAETSISDKVDTNHQRLTSQLDNDKATLAARLDNDKATLATRLALTQDYYKRKFLVYQSMHERLASLEDKMARVTYNPLAIPSVTNALAGFNGDIRRQSLYLSSEVTNLLQSVWDIGIHEKDIDATGTKTLLELSDSIKVAEQAMHKEVSGTIADLQEAKK